MIAGDTDGALAVCTGSVDMLFKDPIVDNGLIIMDWKRSKEIKMSSAYGKGTNPLTAQLDDCNYNHYSLQLTIYKQILEQYYGYTITGCYIVVLHPNQSEYLKIAARPVDEIVLKLFDQRREVVRGLDKENVEPNVKKVKVN